MALLSSQIKLSGILATAVLAAGAPTNAFGSSKAVAMYWGQNSLGQTQQNLATYCADPHVNIFMTAFVNQITKGPSAAPVINLSTQTHDTSLMAQDVKACQQQHGKKVLVSIGGDTYTEGGFSDESSAVAAADLLWSMYGPPNSTTSASITTPVSTRPFGDAIVDGFDLDIETPVTNFPVFANRLRALMDADTSRKYYLTVAPQCPFPDIPTQEMLMHNVKFDAVFVQFYNNPCGADTFIAGSATQTAFNFETWDNWAKTSSANPDVKVFVGVPAGPTAARTGYVGVEKLREIVGFCRKFESFGGVMMWDASQASGNQGFVEGARGAFMGTAS